MENPTVAKKYYRFGVLEGNHVEERFGLDHAKTLKDAKMDGISETRDKFNLWNSMYGVIERAKGLTVPENKELLASTTLAETYYLTEGKKDILRTETRLNEKTDVEKALTFTHYGERPHLTFGHGLSIEDFNKRELATTYNLAHGSQIKPTEFIQTTFDTTRVPTIIRPDEKIYIKDHMRKVPEIGAQMNLENKKIAKPYNEFTKTFDAVQAKIPLRK